MMEMDACGIIIMTRRYKVLSYIMLSHLGHLP